MAFCWVVEDVEIGGDSIGGGGGIGGNAADLPFVRISNVHVDFHRCFRKQLLNS